MANITLHCFSCKTRLEYVDTVGFREECSKCMADVHVCKNCEFYDTSSYNECRETTADPVKEKERANFCDFFKPSSKSSNAKEQTDKLKSAAEALFKKKPN
ncbi:MAG: hypothetical protein KDD37_01285 [Bdellovibrionales bacterium]|nr:hypothetical protein [Bdellovibrionales bacterium]